MNRFCATLAVFLGLEAAALAAPVWQDSHRPLEERTEALLSLMSQSEKIDMLSGGPGAVIRGNPRLGLPPVRMSDGPMGVKTKVEGGKEEVRQVTSFPAGIAMAATWDKSLLREIGTALGRECRANGVDVLLGPSVNIYRVPQCGRNFEYFGEDPDLAAEMAVNYTLGLQSQGVIATIKHFAANNQEYDRYRGNSVVDERTLQEIYFPAFRAAVEQGKIWAVMTAHNPLNGVHCSDNSWLLNDILRGQWGFQGFVISDWNSCYETLPVMKGGVDIEMPGPKVLARDRVEAALKTGAITAPMIDAKVRRIIRACLALGIYGGARPAVESIDAPAHYQIALRAAREGVVLLKNRNGLLPLIRGRVHRLVVLGPLAVDTPHTGGGAAAMPALRQQSLLVDIRRTAGPAVTVEYFDSLASDLGRRAAAAADAVVVAAGFPAEIEGEAHDRPFNLLPEQAALIRDATAVTPRVVVVLMTGGGVDMSPWIQPVAALVHSWYLGDGCGHVIGDLLWGDLNPSGKLPISIEKRWEDSPAYGNYDVIRSEQRVEKLFKPQYEAKYGAIDPRDFFPNNYREGIFVGYRHYDAKEITPLFPFGFGLSYTTFQYDSLRMKVSAGLIAISAAITNTGQREGAEIVQLYVGALKSRLPRPVRELKGFVRVPLQPGETRQVNFTLHEHDLACYDPDAKHWVVEPGVYNLCVAASSRDLRLKQTFRWPVAPDS